MAIRARPAHFFIAEMDFAQLRVSSYHRQMLMTGWLLTRYMEYRSTSRLFEFHEFN
jgi:hypothetical protein